MLCFAWACVQLWAGSSYEKFRSGKGLEESSSFITIYSKKEKLFLEIPDSVMGRRVLVNSFIRTSSNLSVTPGIDISASCAYRIDRTDSLVLFLAPAAPYAYEGPAEEDAMNLSRTDAIVFAIPIKYRNPDNTSFVIEADKLLDPAQKEIADLNGKPYGEYRILSAAFKKELSALKGITSYQGSVGVLRTLTYDIKLRSPLGGELVGTYKFSGDVETCITLLPESSLKALRADSRIGTSTIRYPVVESASRGYRDISWVSRWDLSGDRKIEVYLDTLLAEPWYKAVSDGLLEWNTRSEERRVGKEC